MTYYNEARTHLSLNKDASISREVLKASDSYSRGLISADGITITFGSDLQKGQPDECLVANKGPGSLPGSSTFQVESAEG